MIKKYWNKQMLFEQKDYIMIRGHAPCLSEKMKKVKAPCWINFV